MYRPSSLRKTANGSKSLALARLRCAKDSAESRRESSWVCAWALTSSLHEFMLKRYRVKAPHRWRHYGG